MSQKAAGRGTGFTGNHPDVRAVASARRYVHLVGH